MSKILAFNKDLRHKHSPASPAGRSAAEAADAAASAGDAPALPLLVSVVVPTYRRPELLGHCLAALLSQRMDPARYEIIVVDDAPDDDTRQAVSDWTTLAGERGPAITYIASRGPHGPAAARNRGWRAARGDIIAFTDDDTVPAPDWLENGVEAFDRPDVQAVWGRIVMPLEGQPTDYERDAKGLESAEFVTANCFCPRPVLEQLGGFDERFQRAWREDADLYFRLLQRPGRVVHAPQAVVTHPIRPASWGVSLSQQRKIVFDALLYKKHPQLYRQKIRAAPRWDYYLIVASLAVCAGALLAGHTMAALGAGALWLALTARFCLMRLASTVKTASHIVEMVVTSALIPPLAVFWRLCGAIRFRVPLL
ncbi:MAG: glycosyltransferase family 2 protein [Noviherbaspirillum sp.]